MRVRITASRRGTRDDGPGWACWAGDPDWLSLPQRGDVWFHCPEWTGESFGMVSWNVPGEPVAHDIEVHTTFDVIEHLIADHGWSREGVA